MNPGLVVKLRPNGPWRIGPDSGARNRVDVIYHSDSLYSAITSAMLRLGWLEDWLGATASANSPEVAFSSCFPFVDDIAFVVPPRTVWPPPSPSTKAVRLRWRSARFVPLTVVQSIVAGQRLDENQWTIDGPSDCLMPSGKPGPFRTAVRSSASVDRLTGASERHSAACIEFRPGCGLWAVVSFQDEAAHERWSAKVKAAFRWLADSGFGGERSRGWGRSDAPEFTEGMLPDLILPLVEAAAAVVEPVMEAAVVAAPNVAPLIVEPEPPAPVEAAPAPVPAGEASPQPEGALAPAPDPVPAPESEPERAEAHSTTEQATAIAPAPDPVPAAESEPERAEAHSTTEQATAIAPAPDPVPAAESEPERAEAHSTTEQATAIAPAPDPVPAAESEPERAEAHSTTVQEAAIAPAPDPAPGAESEPERAEAHSTTEPTTTVPAPELAPAAEPEPERAEAHSTTEPTTTVPAPELAPAAEPEPERAEAHSTTEQAAAIAPAPELAPAAGPEPERAEAHSTTEPAPVIVTTPTHPHWLLSLFTPAAADSVDWRRGNYTVLPRSGRIDSPAGSGELKKQIQMVAEGSVLYAETAPRGSAADVAPDGFAHPVFRAGFAVAIPLPEVR